MLRDGDSSLAREGEGRACNSLLPRAHRFLLPDGHTVRRLRNARVDRHVHSLKRWTVTSGTVSLIRFVSGLQMKLL